MQVQPSKHLSGYIKHYLFLETTGHGIKKLRLFSDGNPGMVFCFGNSLVSHEIKGSTPLPNAFIYGQVSAYKDLYIANGSSLIIVVFQPNGINRLLGITANEIKDTIVSSEDIFGLPGVLIYERLYNEPAVENRLHYLDGFFHQLIAGAATPGHTLIDAALHFIIKNKGVITIQQLVKYTGYTERHIERVFNDSIGINPKKFGNIIKLHAFLNLLKYSRAQNNITTLCYEAGYTDQSHLIKEFRKYTGITPTQYAKDTSKLATNFMEINPARISMSGLYNLPGL
ncbi:MAG TPA: AraC family transcriptional regulator [Chitinophagaceae bacterium]|nr:AraC family transcriptional regulator [Chitinophagaceae bacterium]